MEGRPEHDPSLELKKKLLIDTMDALTAYAFDPAFTRIFTNAERILTERLIRKTWRDMIRTVSESQADFNSFFSDVIRECRVMLEQYRLDSSIKEAVIQNMGVAYEEFRENIIEDRKKRDLTVH